MKARALAAAVAIAAVGLTAACGSAGTGMSGTVIEKDYDKGTCKPGIKLSSFEKSLPAGGGGGRGGGSAGGGGRAGSSGSAPKAPSMNKPAAPAKPAAPKLPPNARPKGSPRPAAPMVTGPDGKPCKSDSYELEIRTRDGDEIEVDVSKMEFDRYRTGDKYPK